MAVPSPAGGDEQFLNLPAERHDEQAAHSHPQTLTKGQCLALTDCANLLSQCTAQLVRTVTCPAHLLPQADACPADLLSPSMCLPSSPHSPRAKGTVMAPVAAHPKLWLPMDAPLFYPCDGLHQSTCPCLFLPMTIIPL